ncbi:MAG TPA: hypothetical protein VI819_03945 [Patescibacteria group bacterium]|nr:hypothetical protein [Patescibacteria group bacterium]
MKLPDYSKYIKTSFEIVKKYKWLWILGFILSSSTGAGSYRIANSLSDSIENPQNLEMENPLKPDENLPDMANSVLGTFTGNLRDWAVSIPIGTWVLIALLTLLLIILGISVSLLITNWAKGSLIAGLDMALTKKETPTLENTSPQGIKRLKNLIYFSLLLGLLSFGLVTVIPMVWAVIFYILKSFEILKTLWIIIGGISSVILFFAAIMLLTISRIYAERLIVLENYSPTKAWSTAIRMGKNSLIPTIVTGIVNQAITMAVGCLSIIILGVSLGVPSLITYFIYKKSGEISIILIILICLAFLLFLALSMILRATLTVFNYSNWNQLYSDYLLFEKENEK